MLNPLFTIKSTNLSDCESQAIPVTPSVMISMGPAMRANMYFS